MDIDFKKIVSMSDGQPGAFEELCCQLARRTEEPDHFVRLRGAGGDGGVEGYAELPNGGKRGWQAKYVFDSSGLIKQASNSFRTALKVHADLRSFVLCFPFDLTGKTGRGKGSVEKLDDWKASELRYAREIGRDVKIDLWPAAELRARIIQYDSSGGMRLFFFHKKVLSDQWFKEHLEQAHATAGPRYTPKVNVSTDMAKWFASFGRTSEWSNAVAERLASLEEKTSNVHVRPARKSDTSWGTWPSGSREKVRDQVASIHRSVDTLRSVMHLDKQVCVELKHSLRSSCEELQAVEEDLTLDMDRRYGEGRWDFPHWRQHMAETLGSLPAGKLDSVRSVISTLVSLIDWLESHEFSLGVEPAFLLTGAAGTGKTHGVCDLAHRRHQHGLHTCLLFGHEFSEGQDPWTRVAETLGFADVAREQLLDAMNSAGEASGRPLIVCVDAINETKPLRYWHNHLAAFLRVARSRPFVRVCVVCRTRYVPVCLPEGHDLPQVEHKGFDGRAREACRAYFEHYGLQAPAMPVLQPELRNPLYLRLVCETAASRGLTSLPSSWTGSVPAIDAFLDEKEKRFAHDHGVPLQARTMRETLIALLDHLVAEAIPEVPWSMAIAVTLRNLAGLDRDQASRNLEWLVSEGLLIDDAPREQYQGAESTLRPAFERLGDFLTADRLVSDNPDDELELAPWMATVEDIGRNSGVLSVLSVLLPERRDGRELPDMIDGIEREEALLELTLDALPSRSESAFTARLGDLVRRALGMADISFLAMERLTSIAWRPSLLDANWLHSLLRSKPLAERDAYWCTFLHDSFSDRRTVADLIDAAFDLPLDEVDEAIAARWAKVLLWFTAAADRRVKDRATRAAVAVLSARPSVLPNLVEAMLSVDDDAVRERVLLVAYGVLLQTRHSATLKSIARMLRDRYASDASAFSNAAIRDHMRTICEFAAHLDVLPAGIDPMFASAPNGEGTWPLPLPSVGDVETWADAIRFWPNNYNSDFFCYSMSDTDRWKEGMSRDDMAKWMLRTIAQDFQFIGSGCESYDERMLHEHGGGRGKPVWAERIGKKYMWIALHQLASRLHDNVKRARYAWEPESTLAPPILPEARQLDPSLPVSRDLSDKGQFFTTPRLDTVGAPNDRAWIALEKGVPSIGELVKVQSIDDQDWRPLVAYLSSGRPSDRHRNDSPYRQIWLHLFGYLVRPCQASIFFEKLSGRNFWGRWMPEGLTLGGFIAEYPWTTSFKTIPDEWYSRAADLAPEFLLPAWNSLHGEWEYDASLENTSVFVPAHLFFDGDDLWWDREGGYWRKDGRTVFLDPSLCQSGPSALLADEKDLWTRLQEMDRCLIWTLLGAKWTLGGSMTRSERTPINSFSQVAYMGADGSLRESDLTFFDDLNERTGLA